METDTPIKKAFADYINNRYYTVQILGLIFIIAGLIGIKGFTETFSIVAWFTIASLIIVIPFIFLFIWAYQYKKGTRK